MTMLPFVAMKKPALRAFSLVELLVCVSLLGVILGAIVLPQWQTTRGTASVRQVHQINRALDDLAAGLAVSTPRAFVTVWQQRLKQEVPGITITTHTLDAHSLHVVLTWPSAPGLVAIGTPPARNRLARTVYF